MSSLKHDFLITQINGVEAVIPLDKELKVRIPVTKLIATCDCPDREPTVETNKCAICHSKYLEVSDE